MTITDNTVDTTGLVAGSWTINPAHSEVGFTVRHLMTKVRGQFEKFEGQVTTGASLEDTRTEATIDLNSVNTRDAQRDGHLRSADFFDVANSGPMTFVASSFNGSTAQGDLTIKGVAEPVELDVEFLGVDTDAFGNVRIGFEATTQINRKDYGVNFDIPLDGGRFLVGDKVDIQLSIQAVLDQS